MSPYVLQGISYFLSHRVLWKTTLCPLLWTLAFVIAAFCILLPLAFIPQAIALSAVMTPWLGVPLALLLALIEWLILVMIFSAIFLMPVMDKVFDQVLILRGHGALVELDSGSACCGCCSRVGFIKLFMALITLPLNLIPVVGTILWLFLNGRCYAWDTHSHYFYELKGKPYKWQKNFVRERWYRYHLFGMQAMALEMIPFANGFFAFTNMVGAALWAADMEDQGLIETKDEIITHQQQQPQPYQSPRYPTEETMLPRPDYMAKPYGS